VTSVGIPYFAIDDRDVFTERSFRFRYRRLPTALIVTRQFAIVNLEGGAAAMAVTAARQGKGTGTRGYKAGDSAGIWQVKELDLELNLVSFIIPQVRQSRLHAPCSAYCVQPPR
jgi:hypothetical protein